MTSLKENLDLLGTSLPDVAADLQRLRSRAERVDARAVDVLNELVERDTAASSLLHELIQSLSGLAQHGEAERLELDARAEALEDTVEAALDELAADQARLSAALATAGTAANTCDEALGDVTDSLTGAAQHATKELEELAGTCGEAEDRLRTAFATADGEVDALRETVQEGGEEIRRLVEGLRRTMQEVADEATHRIEQTAERLDGLRSAHEAEVPEQRQRLHEEQKTIVAEMRERVEDEITERIARSTEDVLAALAQMATECEEAASVYRSGREALEPAIHGLREVTRPLPEAIDAVRRAADQLALRWS
jgi:methyl-accepting chemotaxis protein